MKIDKVLRTMKQQDIPTLFVTDPYSIRYLTGYYTDPGERLLMLILKSEQAPELILNRLFPPRQEEENLKVTYYDDGENILHSICSDLTPGSLGIDKKWPSHFLITVMQERPDLTICNGSLIIDQVRSIKTPEEQAIMIKASQLNDQIMDQVIQELNDSITEKELATRVRQLFHETGHSDVSFDPIIGYGANGSDPHHINDESLPEIGDSIIIDIGGLYQNYASDMTRTVFFGKASKEALGIYELVKEANEAAINAIKPGVPLKELDLIARNIISSAGYGDYFTHRLGHFIGQEAHEAGDVSQYSELIAEVGQVFSIEPGIYLPSQMGVRIEDLVLVTDDGCQVLNNYPKEPIIVPIKSINKES